MSQNFLRKLHLLLQHCYHQRVQSPKTRESVFRVSFQYFQKIHFQLFFYQISPELSLIGYFLLNYFQFCFCCFSLLKMITSMLKKRKNIHLRCLHFLGFLFPFQLICSRNTNQLVSESSVMILQDKIKISLFLEFLILTIISYL